MDVKTSGGGLISEITYGGLVIFALVVLPAAILSYNGHYGYGHIHSEVINIVGYNPPGENNAYWSIQKGNSWHFSQNNGNIIRIKEGDTVTLHVTSFDNIHGFSLPEYSINELIYPGKVTSIRFKADKPGKFEFFCNIYCGDPDHWQMKGTLIVQRK